MQSPTHPAVRAWLNVVFGLIVLMVAIGGVTRLTGSGLSMVEWRPLMGAIPPLSQAQWHAVFADYQQTPQFARVNSWMTLSDFRRIFFWEYVHRLLGRGIGVAVLVPWFWFLARKMLAPRLARQLFGLFVLGGLQGALGWFMVKSGLQDEPTVSHLRLAAHLLMAFGLAQAVLWVRLSLDPPAGAGRPIGPAARVALVLAFGAILVQSAWGAFMAGTRAGLFAQSFPDVNGVYSPVALASGGSIWRAVVMEPGPIHAMHRLIAWALVPLLAGVVVVLWRDGVPGVRRPAALLLALLVLQLALGAATVIYRVPTGLATLHQVTALLLLSTVTLAAARGRGAARHRCPPAQVALPFP